MKPWMIIAAVVLLVAVGIFRTTSGGSEVRDVDVAMVAKGDVRSSVIASGQIAFRQEVQLRSEVIGKVVQLSVEEGDAVLKNQLLMRLDPEAFAQEVEQQTASVRMQEIAIERQEQQIAYLQRQLKRQRSLYKKGSVGEETIETYTHNHSVAKTDLAANRHSLAQANARLAKAKDMLSKTEIRAPIDGIVTTLDIKVGETVIAGTTNIVGSSMMTIASGQDLITEVFVDEADIAALNVGQMADVFSVAYPDTALAAQVEMIGSAARQYPGRQGLAFKVRLKLTDTKQKQLFSGLSCRVEIFDDALADTIAVPIEAVLGEGENRFVYVVQDDTAVKRDVTIGTSSDELQQIVSGLTEQDMIVVGPFRGLRTLKDGQAVQFDIDKESAEG